MEGLLPIDDPQECDLAVVAINHALGWPGEIVTSGTVVPYTLPSADTPSGCLLISYADGTGYSIPVFNPSQTAHGVGIYPIGGGSYSMSILCRRHAPSQPPPSVPPPLPPSPSPPPHPPAAALRMSLSGSLTLGGASGVVNSFAGMVDYGTEPEARFVSLALFHAGGWALPLPGKRLITPQMAGELELGPGSRLVGSMKAVYREPLILVPNVLQLATGSRISVDLARASGVDPSTPPELKYEFDATLKLGNPNTNNLPALTLKGEISQSMATWFHLSSTPFTPLPSVMPQCWFPAFSGYVSFKLNGDVITNMSAYSSGCYLADALQFEDMYAGVYAESRVVDPSVDATNVTTEDSPAAVQVQVDFWGGVRLGGADGAIGKAVGVVNVDPDGEAVLTTTIQFEGGWSPASQGGLSSAMATPTFVADLALGPGSYISLIAAARYEAPVDLIPGVIAFVGRPSMGESGSSLDISLSRAADAGSQAPMEFTVRFDGGVRIGPEGSSRLPILGVAGTFSHTGYNTLIVESTPVSAARNQRCDSHLICQCVDLYTSDVRISSLSQFTPIPDALPGLTFPGFTGHFTIDPTGTIKVNATAWVDGFSPFGDMMVLNDFYANLQATVPGDAIVSANASTDSSTKSGTTFTLAVRGALTVGGRDGFSAFADGFIDATGDEQILSLAVAHVGGWEPLPGIPTPAFEAALVCGPGSYLSFAADVGWQSGIHLGPLAVVGSHFMNMTAEAGLKLDVTLSRPGGGATNDPVTFTLFANGGVKLSTLPVFSFEGYLADGGAEMQLYVPEIKPLPAALPGLTFPSAYGEFSLNKNGSLDVFARLEGSQFGLANVISFDDYYASITAHANIYIPPETEGSAPDDTLYFPPASPPPPQVSDIEFQFQFEGTLVVGGEAGFAVSASGSFDSDEGRLWLNLSHAGGWTPLPPLASVLFTPAFECQLEAGPGRYLSLEAYIEFPQPVPIIPSTVALVGFKDKPGISLQVSLLREQSPAPPNPPPASPSAPDAPSVFLDQQGPETLTYSVRMEGGLHMGDLESAESLPTLGVVGELSSGGTTRLVIESEPGFKPVPRIFNSLAFEALSGVFTLDPDGGLRNPAARSCIHP